MADRPRPRRRDGAMEDMPITTGEVFAGLAAQTVVDLERTYGNTDLIRAVDYARLAGPFTVASLTPALTIPEALLETMFERVDAAAARMKSATAMLLKTPPKSLMDLTRVAAGL